VVAVSAELKAIARTARSWSNWPALLRHTVHLDRRRRSRARRRGGATVVVEEPARRRSGATFHRCGVGGPQPCSRSYARLRLQGTRRRLRHRARSSHRPRGL
jgi:hypothetical protein